ncbi:hypothetical protein NU219Hw_g4751t1 [Hortaea werneckii]
MDLTQNRDGAAQKLRPLDRASIWKPLDKEKREIRIILLQPSEEEDDALYADLEIASLDNPPEYKAISYVWGDASDTTAMFMNGGRAIEITRSLAAALRRFRDPKKFVALWADAVCINQADLEERADQVRIMGKIYASAQQVNVWLGRVSDQAWHDALYSFLEATDLPRTDEMVRVLNTCFDIMFPEVDGDLNVCANRSSSEGLLQVVCCDVWRDGNGGHRRTIVPADFDKIQQLWTRIEDAGAIQEDIPEDPNFTMLQGCIDDAQLFLTTSGRLGNAKIGVQGGDFVALFPGCRIPFIIRPVDDVTEQRCFKLISPCYTHGIMDGEALWDTFMAKANYAEKKAYQNDLKAIHAQLATRTEQTEVKLLLSDLAEKYCRDLLEEIVLV